MLNRQNVPSPFFLLINFSHEGPLCQLLLSDKALASEPDKGYSLKAVRVGPIPTAGIVASWPSPVPKIDLYLTKRNFM